MSATSDVPGLLAQIEAQAAKAGAKLRPGASRADLASAEQALGVTLPDDVRTFYLAHDGAEGHDVEGRELLSLERIVSEWRTWQGRLASGELAQREAAPGPGVQARWWHPQWIPVTADDAGDHHLLDLAPADGGHLGQVLEFWHDDSPRTAVAPSLLHFLVMARWGTVDESL